MSVTLKFKPGLAIQMERTPDRKYLRVSVLDADGQVEPGTSVYLSDDEPCLAPFTLKPSPRRWWHLS